MKYRDSDYTTMRDTLIDTMPNGATERQRWDCMWAAIDDGSLDYSLIAPYLDAHTDTALRHISMVVAA